MDEHIKRGKEIIAQNLYITIATVDENNNPWISPLFFAFDENFNFYWNSPADSKHSSYLKKNKNVAIAIFDSQMPEGTGEGVYVQAEAFELVDKSEIENAAKLLYARKNVAPKPAEDFIGDSSRRLYKAVPNKFWINIDEIVDGRHHDARVEINL
jgi:nitroimidazol reductase NimA-like FMN-containing flavoprotein (pyridoxamine 5'-phosphate oxidase superfamily)